MKNLIYLALMIIGLSSCQKEEVTPISNGHLSVRFIDKDNEINQSYLRYDVTADFIIPSGGTKGPNTTTIMVNGKQDANHKFKIRMTLSTNYNHTTNLSEYRSFSHGIACAVNDETKLVSISSYPLAESILITKNDADSLGGTFRVKMEAMPQGSSTNYKEMEGYFCIAKKGIL